MDEHPIIHVDPVNDSLCPALLNLGVLPAQRNYMGDIADLLADAAASPGAEPMAICHGDTPVGYYRIDPHARSVAGHDFAVPALGLRTFFIDADWQGRGFGALALSALIADLAERHPLARLLVLTVNSDNHVASQLYRRSGFSARSELYHERRAGPEQLLLRALP
jgi:GNAT superfamily N-acetyltransferase